MKDMALPRYVVLWYVCSLGSFCLVVTDSWVLGRHPRFVQGLRSCHSLLLRYAAFALRPGDNTRIFASTLFVELKLPQANQCIRLSPKCAVSCAGHRITLSSTLPFCVQVLGVWPAERKVQATNNSVAACARAPAWWLVARVTVVLKLAKDNYNALD